MTVRVVRRLLALERWTSFVRDDGRVCYLRESNGLATKAQLYRLNALGRLVVVADPVEPLSKGEAAFAIDATKDYA